MEAKTIYREYFPGYMGHIPYKNEVIGMTVGATNEHIRSYLTREPDYEQKLVPSTQSDYSYYNKGYFNENMAKDYNLEEDKVYSNKSKDAKTWISGSKFKIYPQHIPGYKAHIPGMYSSNIFGMSYSKASSVAVKGDYCKTADLPSNERYRTMTKMYYDKPKMRSEKEEVVLKNTIREDRSKSIDPSRMLSTGNHKNTEILNSTNAHLKDYCNDMPDSFKKILNYDTKPTSELPYIVGYKGFRKGVKAGNYYGKNFREISITSINNTSTKN